MVQASNLGFPRIGAQRELKKATESFWKGQVKESDLQAEARRIRAENWKTQKNAGIAVIPSNDFSFYDQVLDTICAVGAVPSRYGFAGGQIDLDTYFAMARGSQGKGRDVVAMEMTKWFDTNYHYIVPEFKKDINFRLSSTKAVDEFKEAKALGIETRPVIVGPVTLLLIGKERDGGNALALLDKLLPVYAELLKNLESAGAKALQIDEPYLVMDLPEGAAAAYKKAYDTLAKATGLKITIATYFGDLRDNVTLAANLPVAGLHVDLVRGAEQLDKVLAALPKGKTLSLGLIDGRNIWRADLEKALVLAEKAAAKIGKENVQIAGSCSLLHTPVDLNAEKKLDAELKGWLSFATQKLSEIAALATALEKGKDAAKEAFDASKKAIDGRKNSKRIHNDSVKQLVANISKDLLNRKSSFGQRAKVQHKALNLPILPTTTIGSFPQTAEVRAARAKFKKGELTAAQYDQFLKDEIEKCVKFQEQIGIDVLVHGEFERNDMVEYFGEQLKGFAFSENGWVQSYGSRCVKPPIIFGDVWREKPMTVDWAIFAQSKTKKIMKGMLTGPVTILQWSFVRDDQPRRDTCLQIAFAIRKEVTDLEKAGIKIIQIDEAALREGLPLRKTDWDAYLKWAVDAFRISASDVRDDTQIHTHMCYSEFNDIIGAVAAMDADVISIETSRSAMELLEAFVDFKYPNEIGPGVYDIHSPRVPATAEMEKLLNKALEVLKPEQVWVNPDCGLKTRGWPEVTDALKHMVEATEKLRKAIGGGTQQERASA
jgi:5-methyltetrahydropteroyltriglutamate--homocysteine methyltransferase